MNVTCSKTDSLDKDAFQGQNPFASLHKRTQSKSQFMNESARKDVRANVAMTTLNLASKLTCD